MPKITLPLLLAIADINKDFVGLFIKDMERVARESGTHSTYYKQLQQDRFATITRWTNAIIQAAAKLKQDDADITSIQVRSPVQQTAPQLPSSSHSDLRLLYDKNIGYKDTTGQEIILRTLAMAESDTKEFSHHKILLYLASYLQTKDNLRTSIDPAQRDAFYQLALGWCIDGLQPPAFRQNVLAQDFKTFNALGDYISAY